VLWLGAPHSSEERTLFAPFLHLASMEQYRTDPTRTQEVRSEMLRRTVPMMVFVAVILTVILVFMQNRDGASEHGHVVTLVTVPVFALIMIYSVRKVLTQQTSMYVSFTVTLEPDRVTRHIEGFPPLSITHASLKRIEERPDGTLILHGEGKQNVIGISKYMVDLPTLRERLAQLQPIASVPAARSSQLWVIGAALLGVVALAATFVSDNKLVVALCGSLTLILLIGSFIVIQWSKHLDRRSKRRSWVIFLVLFSLVSVMYQKLVVLP
jgi:hypothetical protein